MKCIYCDSDKGILVHEKLKDAKWGFHYWIRYHEECELEVFKDHAENSYLHIDFAVEECPKQDKGKK